MRLYAPKGTPKPVIDKLTNALQDAMKDSTVKQRFADLGTEPVARKPRHAGGVARASQSRDRQMGANYQEGWSLCRLIAAFIRLQF